MQTGGTKIFFTASIRDGFWSNKNWNIAKSLLHFLKYRTFQSVAYFVRNKTFSCRMSASHALFPAITSPGASARGRNFKKQNVGNTFQTNPHSAVFRPSRSVEYWSENWVQMLSPGSIGKFPENDGFLAVIPSNVDENQKKFPHSHFSCFRR